MEILYHNYLNNFAAAGGGQEAFVDVGVEAEGHYKACETNYFIMTRLLLLFEIARCRCIVTLNPCLEVNGHKCKYGQYLLAYHSYAILAAI